MHSSARQISGESCYFSSSQGLFAGSGGHPDGGLVVGGVGG
ncbi:MAG: hypothetical protein ACD_23C00749G0002, partial [uncultured bacterium]